MAAIARHIALDDPRWRMIAERDPRADGSFWYGVTTTGVFCNPSCASRRAHPEHVTLHGSVADARAAGYRPCKRCRPDVAGAGSENAALIANACRHIEQSEAPPSLDELAAAARWSPGYFHRVFKRITGVTPKAYATAHRAARVRQRLAAGRSVTEAMYGGGFNSSGRFYAQSTGMLGMTPRRFRAGGAREELRFAVGQCSLGAILVASSAKGVASIMIGDDPDALVRNLQDQFSQAHLLGGDAAYESLVARVVGCVEAPGIGLDLPLDIRGTAFQRRVWQALCEIPAGCTMSYRDVANQIGSPGAVRAVAGACAANTLAIAIPCHRVVRSNGALSGYRWGVERKRTLLNREAAVRVHDPRVSRRQSSNDT